MKSIALRIGLVLVLVCGAFLVYGFYIWLTYTPAKQTVTSSKRGTGTEDFRALFEREVKLAGPGEAESAADSVQLLAIDSSIENFRAGAVRAADMKAVTALPEVAPGALQELLRGQISAKFPYIWPYLIAGSFVVMGNTLGDQPVVAFYNPYFDIALLTKWTFREPGQPAGKPSFVLIQAIPTTGRAFIENRPSLSTDQPIWSDSKGILEFRIVNAAQNFVKVFEQRYPPFDRGSVAFSAGAGAIAAAITVAEKRVFDLLTWVIDAQNASAPVNYASGIHHFREALAASSPGELSALLPADNPQGAPMFFQLPADVRKGMKPYLVINQNVIFLNPIDLPTGFISVHFTPATHGYVPGLVGFFNMAASYPGR
jgi:hypothetical protein